MTGYGTTRSWLLVSILRLHFGRAWWFYLAAVLLITGIVYGLYHFRITQIRKEEQLKTEFNRRLSEVEMSALRSQMNPHFLFNSLNSINRYIVKSDPETASGLPN